MAELIPLEYRIAAARKVQIRRWTFVGTLTAIACGAAVLYTLGIKQRHASERDVLDAEYRSKSLLLLRANESVKRRQDLADRMAAMQNLLEDKVLLSLLQNASQGFSTDDVVDYISVDAHGRGGGRRANAKGEDGHKYNVRLSGITKTEGTHADLLTRLTNLGSKSDPPLTVTPESLRRQTMLDGQVMRFQIVCEKPEPAVKAEATENKGS